jgi:hypothetical protein
MHFLSCSSLRVMISLLKKIYGFDVPEKYRGATFDVEQMNSISDPELKLGAAMDWRKQNFDSLSDDQKWEMGLWVEKQAHRVGIKVGFFLGAFIASILWLILS